MIESNTADIPTGSVTSYYKGVNAPGGPVQSVLFHLTTVSSAQIAATDVSTLLTQMRVTINGDVVHDWRAIGADNTSTLAGRAGYFYNSIGGRSAQTVDDATAADWWLEIPIGINLPAGTNRFEFATSFLAAASTPSSGKVEFWVRYNTDLEEQTLVGPATSFTHANALEQVVVRIPETSGGVVSSILVQNDSDAAEFNAQGIRANALSDYGFTASMMGFITNELQNGIQYGDEGASTTAQIFAVQRNGCNMIPLFGLAGGDVYLQVDSSAATTRLYTATMRLPVAGGEIDNTVQTVTSAADPSSVMVGRTAN